MNPRYPIYVISKGRPKSCLTARKLTEMKVPFYLVVEPQELEEYQEYHPKVTYIVTPFSNLGQGSIPVRNFVWEHSKSKGSIRHWILDDNIEGFHRFNRNIKPQVTDGTIFRCCEDFTERYSNVPISGMNYYAFCKNSSSCNPFTLNTRVYSCILIKNDLPFRWRGRYNEDTDLCLRVLKSGQCTILFNAFLVGKVTTMRMKGGNTEEVYGDTDNRKEFAESLRVQHPEHVKVVWKFNRWHHDIDYRKHFTQGLERLQGLEVPTGTNDYGMKLIELPIDDD